jgi:hypothetical protein
VTFALPIAEIAHIVDQAHARGEGSVNIAPASVREVVAIINHELAQAEGQEFGFSSSPTQTVDRIYWSVSLASIARILDVVRTTLVELIAEMRAETPSGEMLPSRDIAEQAVDVAIYGKRNRVVIAQVGSGGQVAAAASGTSSLGAGEAETGPRRVMWWLAGAAAIVAAITGVWVLFLS